MSTGGHLLTLTAFALYAVTITWAGVDVSTAFLAALLGYALFVCVVEYITADTVMRLIR